MAATPAFVMLGNQHDLARSEAALNGMGDFGLEAFLPLIGTVVSAGAQIGIAEYTNQLAADRARAAARRAALLAQQQALEEARRQQEFAQFALSQGGGPPTATPSSASPLSWALLGGGLLTILALFVGRKR